MKSNGDTGLFDGKVALVTGGLGAIGGAIAQQLSGLGATVVIADKRSEGSAGSSHKAKNLHIRQVDITNPQAVEALVASIEESDGRLDIVINNAAEFDGSTLLGCSEKDWARVLHTNVDGSSRVIRHALPIMQKGGDGGAIVNVVSVAGLVGLPERAAYATSKGALVAMTRQLARDFAQDGIRINAVAPGVVDGGPFHRASDFVKNAEAARSGVIKSLPLTSSLGRMISTEDVANAVTFLASPKATMITGVVLPVDAGLTAS